MAAKELDTTRNAVPFDKANIPGPKMAKAVKAVVAGKFISKAKRPLLIVGTAAGDDGVIEIVRSMSEKGIPVAATGSSLKRLKEEGIDATYVNLHALVSYLKDPDWKGFDGKGGYDTTIFLGHTYYYTSQFNIHIIFTDPFPFEHRGYFKREFICHYKILTLLFLILIFLAGNNL